MLDTPCSEVMWRVLATHSIHQVPLQFLSRASQCAITFQRDSTNDSFLNWQTINIFTIKENTCFQNNNITSEYRAVCCGYLVKYFHSVRRSFTVHIKMVYRCYCKVMFLFFCRLNWPQRVNKYDKNSGNSIFLKNGVDWLLLRAASVLSMCISNRWKWKTVNQI